MAPRPYKTIEHDSETELIIQKSRFLGRAFRVGTEEEVNAVLSRIRKQHYDATHNCYAYSLGINGELARFSDDGEPGGTAGLPMMEAVRQKGVTNVLVIVTRYFGGILLGAGGLVRAYSKSCSLAVEQAGIVSMTPGVRLSLTLDYPLYGAIEGFLRENTCDFEAAFSDRVTITAAVGEEDRARVQKEITERTLGRVPVLFGESVYMKKRLEKA